MGMRSDNGTVFITVYLINNNVATTKKLFELK